MQSILNNLTDASWWFTSFVPALLIIFFPKLVKYAFKRSKKIFRSVRARHLWKVKGKRLDDLLIQREMFSEQAAFNVFMTFISAGFIILVLNPYSGMSGKSVAYGIIVSVPILISELFWLSKDARVQDLIVRRKRWLNGKKQVK
ncbi:hypothetical protein CTR2_R29800 [Comamonas thiooxydans]|uniref:hypothetical protein n=1 Tax=Comamonas thiooxydans TaxID=363952 RepID=UPI000B34E6DC|nr:hypothetical protein [Comamonas thiooxydans]BDR09642.1 hypothetical protein CTR2_R29800 [Comamonas thiooxydans]